MAQLREISQLLSIYTNPTTGKCTRGCTADQYRELWVLLWDEVMESKAGRKLEASLGYEAAKARIFEVASRQYPDQASLVMAGAYETVEQIARDLLVELPASEQPAVAPQQKVAAAPVVSPEEKERLKREEEARQKHEGRVRQFAYLVRKQLETKGYRSLKPRAGIVIVVSETGQSYEYPSQEFENLYADAAKLGLLTVGGLN